MVYYNVRTVLDPNSLSNYQKYSEEDHAKVLELVEAHGQNWKLIGQMLGRTAKSVSGVYYFKPVNKSSFINKPPTEEQINLLVQEIQSLHPDKDLAVDHIQSLPWTQLAKKIDYFPDNHGYQVWKFWNFNIKYRDSEGVLRLKRKDERIPRELYRKFAKHAAKAQPTHFNALDWPYYFKMFEGRVASIHTLRKLIKTTIAGYKINIKYIGLAAGLKQWYKMLKQRSRLEFEALSDMETCTEVRDMNINQYHWAVSPDLAHYVQDRPVMHWGYKQDQLHKESPEVKQEPEEDPDIVW